VTLRDIAVVDDESGLKGSSVPAFLIEASERRGT